jgi:hypothetical protein
LIDAEIERDARDSAWEAVRDEFLDKAQERWAVAEGEEGDQPTFAQVEETIRWYQKLYKERSSVTIALILFMLVGSIIAFIANLGLLRSATVTATVGVLGSVWTGLSQFRRWATDTAQRFKEAKAANRRLSEEMREELLDNPDSLVDTLQAVNITPRSEVAAKAHKFSELDDEFEAKQAEVETRRQRVGMAARHGNLLDFVKQRLEGRFYEDKLGLLHQVKSDLEDLSDALLHGEDLSDAPLNGEDQADDPLNGGPTDDLFPRGKPRIILLIDDLDRCPPDKVVEVLEAAQLLVKTPLFVVVVAMDVRYVTRALEKVYQGVLIRGGEPSGLDYIEKIVQIPYRVRPVSAAAVGSFLRWQMSPLRGEPGVGGEPPPASIGGAEGPPEPQEQTELQEGEGSSTPIARPYQSELRVLPTETLEFYIEDHELISTCCVSFEVSPRTMKRLVNVFKLLKIIWYRQGLDKGPEREVKRAMLALLVIAARFPEPMRQLLYEMERVYVEPQPKSAKPVVEFLLDRCREHRDQALIPQDWGGVKAALSNPDLISQELTFEELHERHLHLVSTFSFIGENDPEREATLRRDLSRPLLMADAQAQGSEAEQEAQTASRFRRGAN